MMKLVARLSKNTDVVLAVAVLGIVSVLVIPVPSMVLDFLRSQEIDVERRHETGAESDLIALLEAGVGVAILPRSTKAPDTLLRLMVDKLDLNRTVYLYGVAGRQRTAVASTLMKMLRASDWSRFAAPALSQP